MRRHGPAARVRRGSGTRRGYQPGSRTSTRGRASSASSSTGRLLRARHRARLDRGLPRTWSPSAATSTSPTGCGPRSGLPGRPRYRDFHTFDHDPGLKPGRVTSARARAARRRRPTTRTARRAVSATRRTSSPSCGAGSSRSPAAGGRPGLVVGRSTPSCSATGGTRARRSCRGCCALLPLAGCAHHDAARRDRRRRSSRARVRSGPARGDRQGLAGLGGAEVADLVELNERGCRKRATRRGATRVADPYGASDPLASPGGAAGAVERLGVHGHQGLRGRTTPASRRRARSRA